MSDEIEHIYDRLIAAEKLKAGTKYERLAAFVFQILDRSALVVHDVVLRGSGKEASHQIDVLATDQSGASQRVIVETRDRRGPVDLKQVRDFFGVVHQLKPEHAWIVSSTGFTGPATSFARDESIGLAQLRSVRPGEDNRVKAIRHRMHMQAMGDPTVTCWLAADDRERERLQRLLKQHVGSTEAIPLDEAYFYDDQDLPEATFREVMEPIFQSIDLRIGDNRGTYSFDRVRRVDIMGIRGAVRGFKYSVELVEAIHEFITGNPDSIAELIFRSVEGTIYHPIDRVIYDTELRGLEFDEDGRIVSRRA